MTSKKILLDTHVLVWLLSGQEKIGKKTLKLIESSVKSDELYVSAISFWEVAMLVDRGRIELNQSAEHWRRDVVMFGIKEVPLCGAIALESVALKSFHPDPADRMIVATAKHNDYLLLTCDKDILKWRGKVQISDAGK